MLTHISLFAGIGGIDIAAEWAGFKTVLFVEKDEYCQKVLKKHWPDVPIIGDIRDVTKETVKEITINTCSLRCNTRRAEQSLQGIGTRSEAWDTETRIAEDNQPITIITGGVPCQPASVAGKRKGTEDDRWLWPEAIRVVSGIKPTWFVFENVSGILTLENGVVFDNLLSELEGQGYETQSFFIPACGINAPHRRYRVFIVAHSTGKGRGEKQNQDGVTIETIQQAPTGELGRADGSCDVTDSESRESREQEARNRGQGISRGSQEDVADSNRQGLQGHRGLRECRREWLTWEGSSPLEGIWESEPELGRVASGIPSRVDRLKCLGNAVVPQQIYPILKNIAEIERAE